jgi:chromosome segregation ATPase
MKNILLGCVLPALLLLSACKNSDARLVGELEEALARAENEQPDFAAVRQNLATLQTALQTAPEDMRLDTSTHFAALEERAGLMSARIDAVEAQYNDLRTRLGVLLDDYKAGRAQTPAVRDEAALLRDNLEATRASVPELGAAISQYEAEFGRASAEWRAKAEQ